MDFSNKKIAVVGIGGVGGFVAAQLIDRYPKVSLVARGARKESIEQNGLVLHSEYRGEKILHPYQVVEKASQLEAQDYIFICVKNYSLEEVCQSLGGSVDEHTVLIPVMNGADPGERVRKYAARGTVLDSLIYIIAFANDDFSIRQQGQYADIHLGTDSADAREKQLVLEASELLNGAMIDCHPEEDIHRAIWKKYIFNCAYNVETAAYNNNLGQLRQDPVKVQEFEQLIQEAYEVAVVKGIHVTKEDTDKLLHRFHQELPDHSTSSLQRDVVAGRKTEVETFCGYLVREGARLGIAMPVTERMYEMLLRVTNIG